MMLDVISRRRSAGIPHRSIGMAEKRLQLRSNSVRLVRKAKFWGRRVNTFLDTFRISRS